MSKARLTNHATKEENSNLSASTEQKSFAASIRNLRDAAVQLAQYSKRIPRQLLWISSWGPESHAITNAAALRFIRDQTVPISDAEIINGIRYLAARRYNIIAGVIPNILLTTSVAHKMALEECSISELINSMRFITERFIVLRSIVERTSAEDKFCVSNYEEFTKFEDSVFETAIGTRFDWSRCELKFEDMGKTAEYEFSDDNVSRDMSRKNILTLRDKVQRNFPGLNAYYNYCSEFTHPNIGDLETVGLDLKLLKANDGHLLRLRQLATLPKLIGSEQRAGKGSEGLLVECILYSAKIISAYIIESQEIISRLTIAERWIDKEIHRLIKRNRRGFDQKDLCPCGSGKTIKHCGAISH